MKYKSCDNKDFNPCKEHEPKGCEHRPVNCPPPAPCLPPWRAGCSPEEQLRQAYKMVEFCLQRVDNMEDKACGVIEQIRRASIVDGAYYDKCVVKTEQGYDGEESAAYTVITIRHKDEHCNPVVMQLRPAFMNTTNSGLTEDAFHASECELADKMVSASHPMEGSTGWFGHTFLQGVPIPSNAAPDLFTMAFTKSGRLKWYKNDVVTADTLRRDGAYNSIGVHGVSVVDHQAAPENLRQFLPNKDVKASRVLIGQRNENKDIVILVCGDFEAQGLTSLRAAQIMAGYVDVAVEVASGGYACALDKGQVIFPPTKGVMPDLTAYWYVSNKCNFTNDYQRELALLMQKYGKLYWEVYLLKSRITNVENKLDEVVGRLDSLEERVTALEECCEWAREQIGMLWDETQRLQDEITRVEAESIARDEALGERIDGVIVDVSRVEQESKDRDAALQTNIDRVETESKERDTTLQTNIDRVETESIARDDVLDQRIDTERAERIAEDTRLNDRISDEVARINNELTEIERKLNTEISDRIAGDAALQSQVDTINTTITQIRSDLTALDEREAAHYAALNERMVTLETRIQTLLDLMTQLQTQIAELDRLITNMIETINEFKDLLIKLEELVNGFNDRITALEQCCEQVQGIIETIQTQIETINTNITEITQSITTINERLDGIDTTLETHRDKTNEILSIEESELIDLYTIGDDTAPQWATFKTKLVRSGNVVYAHLYVEYLSGQATITITDLPSSQMLFARVNVSASPNYVSMITSIGDQRGPRYLSLAPIANYVSASTTPFIGPAINVLYNTNNIVITLDFKVGSLALAINGTGPVSGFNNLMAVQPIGIAQIIQPLEG